MDTRKDWARYHTQYHTHTYYVQNEHFIEICFGFIVIYGST